MSHVAKIVRHIAGIGFAWGAGAVTIGLICDYKPEPTMASALGLISALGTLLIATFIQLGWKEIDE